MTALVIDGTNVLYRSHHALSGTGLTHAGRPVWAVHGLLTTTARLVRQFQPTSLVVAFDSPGGCPARRRLQPAYKQTRQPPAQDLAYQLMWAPLLLDQCALGTWQLDGWEADDGIASACASAPGDVVVASSDRDVIQLLSDRVRVCQPDGTVLTADAVTAKYGVRPEQYAHLAALRGEPSDNLPGVRGVGAKTASALIARFGTLDAVLDASDGALRTVVGPKAVTALREDADVVRVTFAVGQLRTDLAVDWARAGLLGASSDSVRRHVGLSGLPRAGEALADALAGTSSAA